MLGRAVAFAAAVCLGASVRAQELEPGEPLTAEEMIGIAREEWRSPDLRRCPQATPDEIVVCQPATEDLRVESPTDEAIRTGRPMPDGIPRAPYVLGLPECGVEVVCHRIGRPRPAPLIIDLAALPHPLTPEEAALVFRAEDLPTEAATADVSPAPEAR